VIRLRTFLLRNACMGNDRLLELSSTGANSQYGVTGADALIVG
jgi:hypothetical protein